MGALRNVLHEMFCRTWMDSPDEFVRHNSTEAYRIVYPRASKKTASVNGSRLKDKCRARLLEMFEEKLSHKGEYQPIRYKRGVKKKFNLDKQEHSQKSDPPRRPIDQPKVQDAPKETGSWSHQLPKNQQVEENEPDPYGWDNAL